MIDSDIDDDRKKKRKPPVRTFIIDPFDIGMYSTEEGVAGLHQNFENWLSGLVDPARFVNWLLPVSLADKIEETSRESRRAVVDGETYRSELCQQYRRHYEELQAKALYQRSVCGMAMWTKDNPIAVASGMRASFDTGVSEGEWPALLKGDYRAVDSPFWHLAPVGVQKGRPYWGIMSSFSFNPTMWNFFRPLPPLLGKEYPMAIAVDISRSYDRNEAIDRVEGTMSAYQAHLANAKGEDSRAIQKMRDCKETLWEINQGDTLHEVQVVIAISANTPRKLRERMLSIKAELKPYMGLREEVGEMLMRSVFYFAPVSTADVGSKVTEHAVTSKALSLFLSPMGYPKLSSTRGILRGDSVTGNYPLFYDSWRDKRGRDDKRCSHEIWVGLSGYGKTYYNNCYLTREYAEGGIPFDLLEPMGHGRMVAEAFDLPWYSISSRTTILNPQDVVMPYSISDQIAHVIRLYETMLGRPLSGAREANVERGFLGEALKTLYSQYPSLDQVEPEDTPTCEDLVIVLMDLGKDRKLNGVAQALADEIASVATGNGPFAEFVNGHTNMNLSYRKEAKKPRVFSFHEMGTDPIMLGLAYTQVLSAIRRDSLADDRPRIIAVDEVYRLMRHPALLDFLVEAAKTFRTRRKKLICIDQQMSVFMTGGARFIFENSPIRVIFNQRQGMNVFDDDPAFVHMNAQHKNIIRGLQRFHYVLDIQDEGLYYCKNNSSPLERRMFGSS